MALATRCPHCRTTFRVSNDQLKLREGLVRCGSCREVFDGRLYLVDMPSVSATRAAARKIAAKKLPAPAVKLALPSPALKTASDADSELDDDANDYADDTVDGIATERSDSTEPSTEPATDESTATATGSRPLTPEQILALPLTESIESRGLDASKLVVEEVDAGKLALNDYAIWAATHAAPLVNPSDSSRSDAAWLDDAVKAAVELAEGRKKKPPRLQAPSPSGPTPATAPAQEDARPDNEDMAADSPETGAAENNTWLDDTAPSVAQKPDLPPTPAVGSNPLMGDIDLSDIWSNHAASVSEPSDDDASDKSDISHPENTSSPQLDAALKAAEAARQLEERLSNEIAESAARQAAEQAATNARKAAVKEEDQVILDKFVIAPVQAADKSPARSTLDAHTKWPSINGTSQAPKDNPASAAVPAPVSAGEQTAPAVPHDPTIAPPGTIITTPDWLDDDDEHDQAAVHQEQAYNHDLHQQLNPPTLIHKAEDMDVSELEPDFFARAQARDNEPAFVVQARLQDFHNHRRRGLMIVGSAALAALLVFQSAYFFRDGLSVHYPSLQKPLAGMCRLFHCHISLPRVIDGIAVEANELRAIDPRTSHFAMTMLLRNQSGLRQTWPDVELTLNDSNDQVVSRRVFAPAEYLPTGTSVENGFENRGEQPVRIDFELLKGRAAGYRVAIFYR